MLTTVVEFHLSGSDKNLAVVDSEAVPRDGEFVNIRMVTYRVVRVTWAVDAPDARNTRMRANVEIEATS